MALALPAAAQDATWLNAPGSGDFNTGANWDSAAVPTGTAFFDTSGTTALSFSASTSLGGWTFNPGASAYSFTIGQTLQFTGAGIVVNGGSAAITNNFLLYFEATSTAGSATITNHGFLNFANTSNAANAAITTNSGGSLNFFNTSTAGNATITNNSGGTLNFDNASTAGSAAITNSGGLDFFDASTAGSATITNDGTMNFIATSTAGNAAITNNNVMSFTDTSTAASAAITSDGNVNFYSTSTAGSATITNNVGGTMNFIAASTAGNASITSNSALNFYNTSTAGSASIINTDYLNFYDTSTAGSAAITNDGITNFNNSSSAGSAAITNNFGRTLSFVNTSTAGNATITNDGVVHFFGTSTAGNATITNNSGSSLGFFNTSTAGSAAITNDGTVQFNQTSTAGNAALVNNAGGTVNFSNSTGPNGDDRLSAGSIAGAGNYILGAKELTVGSNNLSTDVSGVISGAVGALVKTGTGTLTLSGANTYTGATTVNAGTLAVNGSILASSGVTVNSGGALGGIGVVGATTIASGGSLAPGNSIGTLTVQGNLTFNAGSSYTIEVSPTAADRTNVTGTATLTGATVQAIALAGSFRQQTYTIMNATGGFGGTQFAGLTGSSFAPGARNPHLTYDLNNVYLVLDPGTIQIPAGIGGNQAGVASAINNFVVNGGAPPAGFDPLLNMTGAALDNALGQVSGQPGPSASQSGSAAPGQFVNAVFGTAFGGGSTGGAGALGFAEAEGNAYAPKRQVSRQAKEAYAAVTPRDSRTPTFEGRWGVFASVYGGNNRVGGDTTAGTNTTTSRTYGAVVGADYRFTRDTQAGFALGGAGSSFGIDGGYGSGKADIFNAAIYGRHDFGAAYVAGALSYSWQDTTTDRTVTISGVDKLSASFKAQALAARLEGGWRYATPLVGIAPYAALQSTTFYMPAYGETATSGSNQFALSYASKTTTNVRTELGARFDKAIAVQGGVFTLTNRTAWAHDSSVDSSASATFQSLPGATFTTNGAGPSPNGLLLSLGAEMAWHNGWSIAGLLDGEFSRTTAGYTGKGTVRYAW